MDAVLDSVIKSSPIYGPVLAASWIALAYVTKEWRAAMHARVADAQETTKTLVTVNTTTTTVLNGLTTALTANREAVQEVDSTLQQVREALPRRSR
jgi:hypothetical protein